MLDNAPGAESSPPTCPHCNGPLRLGGKIVEERGIKKWLDQWECPTHGAVGHASNDQESGTS
jgi:hypothetical protein